MGPMDAKQVFNFILDHQECGKTPDGHFSTYLDDHYDFTQMAEALEAYVQQRIAENQKD